MLSGEHHICYILQNIVFVINLKWMRYVGHVAYIGSRRNVCKVFVAPSWRPRHI